MDGEGVKERKGMGEKERDSGREKDEKVRELVRERV